MSSDGELRQLAGQFGHAIISREIHIDNFGFASRHANKTGLKLGQHAAAANDNREVIAFTTLELFAINGAHETDIDAVSILRCALNLAVSRLLRAQLVDHGINIRLGNLRRGSIDFECFYTGQLKLGIYLKYRAESHVLTFFSTEGFDTRTTCRREVLFRYGL